MTVLMLDAIHASVGNIPASTPKVAGYVTGTPDIAWIPTDWERFPQSGKVRIWQSASIGSDPHAYDVIDVENGAATPDEFAAMVHSRIAAGITWTTVYASDGALPAVYEALYAAGPHGWFFGHVDCWVANWNLNLAQATALIGAQVHGLTCRAVQWASPSSNPGTLVPGGGGKTLAEANVDLSITAQGWHDFVAPKPPLPAWASSAVVQLRGLATEAANLANIIESNAR